MLVDHHVHLEHGPYSEDWLHQFISMAQERQVDFIGIVEHSTQFPELKNHISAALQRCEQPEGMGLKSWLTRHQNRSGLDAYCDFVRRMAPHYPQVAFGLEVDCCSPEGLSEIAAVYEWDFLIGSVHFIDGLPADHPRILWLWENYRPEEIYAKYIASLYSMVQSGHFDFVGHLDVLKMVHPFSWEELREQFIPLLDLIAEKGIAVEINTAFSYRHGVREEFCPSFPLLRELIVRGVPLTLSSDAHHPKDLGTHLEKAREYLLAEGVTEVYRFVKRQRIAVPLHRGC